MGYKTPNSNHPWRQYKDRYGKDPEKPIVADFKNVHSYLTDLTSNWNNIEVTTFGEGMVQKKFLTDLPQNEQALWLVSLLKKMYNPTDSIYD